MFKKDTLQHLLITALFFLLVGFSFSVSAETTNGEEEPDQYVQARLISDHAQVTGGEVIRVGLEQKIYPKWHTYWKNPGDSGVATQIDWDLPAGFSVTDMEWPIPLKIPYGPLTNYGYETYVTTLQNLQIPDDIGTEAFTLNGRVNLLVCHDICIPETHDVSITFNNGGTPEESLIKAAESNLPTAQEWETEFYEQDGNLILKTTTEYPNVLYKVRDLFLAPEDWGAVDNNADATVELLQDGFQITQKRGDRDLNEISELPFVISYVNTGGGQDGLRLIATPSTDKPLVSAVAQTTAADTSPKSSINIVQALIFALLGGLVLNLMPCVFPVLSMKALSLINLNDKEEKKARGYGLSYTAGILLSFAVIASTLLILKAGGATIGWGFQLQNPIVIILLAYLVFIIGLSLSGFFELNGRFMNIGQGLAQKSGNRGAFFTGVLATLVATPCTAPFMGAAMGYALTQPAVISLLVFLALGFGLALPYLALCYVPALRSKLPKPGVWMKTFQQFLAFPMYITAAWLLWVLSQQISTIGVFCALLGLITITFTIWLIRKLPTKGTMRIVTQILILLSAGFIIFTVVTPRTAAYMESMENIEGQNWRDFSTALLDTVLEETDAPIFVEMTASWCITCKVNERVAIKTTSTKELFKELDVQYLKGDWTNQNPEITQYINSFDRQGVPLYVHYGARDAQTGKRPDAVVLPQILTPGIIEKAFR